MILKIICTILLIGSLGGLLNAQDCDYEPSSKVVKLLDKSKNTKKYSSDERFDMMMEAIELDENCLPCLQYLGNSSFKRSKRNGASFIPAINYYEKLIAQCPEYHSNPYYALGAMCYASQEYDKAKLYFDKFIHFPADDETKFKKNYDKKYEDVKAVLPHIDFWQEFYDSDIDITPKRVLGVSSNDDDYLPTISADGEIMFYTRKIKKKSLGDTRARNVELFCWSHREDINTNFDDGEPLPKPFNIGSSYGGATISVNNKEMYIAAKNPVPNNKDNIDIFKTEYHFQYDEKAGKNIYKWSELELLGTNINSENGWESQPSLSGDGQMLFFAAVNATTTPDSRGNQSHDILVSHRQEDGTWGPSRSLGANINTEGQEKAPFMHSDSRTLYFSSNGHFGRGKMDIFYTKLKEDGSWTDPKNIGHPINTNEDEVGLIVSADGEEAYFFSRREKGAKGYDIFSFKMPAKHRPEKVMVLKGELKDENNNIVTDATIELTYAESKVTKEIKVSDDDGRYATIINIQKNENVVLTVKKEGIAFNSRVVARKDEALAAAKKENDEYILKATNNSNNSSTTNQPSNQNNSSNSERINTPNKATERTVKGITNNFKKSPSVIKLAIFTEIIKPNKPFVINDIFYKTNSSEIDEESKLILEQFAKYLLDNSQMRIEIRGHTDNIGSNSDNLALSMDRAFEVKGFLEKHGVSGNRITAKGYGETKSIASNDTVIGRSKNRRTEFVVK